MPYLFVENCISSRASRKVSYVDKQDLEMEIIRRQLAYELAEPDDGADQQLPTTNYVKREHARPVGAGGKTVCVD